MLVAKSKTKTHINIVQSYCCRQFINMNAKFFLGRGKEFIQTFESSVVWVEQLKTE
jgi:hypothetical protein